MKKLISFCCFALLLSGCGLTRPQSEHPLRERLSLQSFELQSINGQSLSERMGDQWSAQFRPTLEFQQDFLLAGQAGCNRFFGQGLLRGDHLTLSSSGLTRMMCSPEQMKLERLVLELLTEGAEVELKGDVLHLRGTTSDLLYLKSYASY